MSNPRMGMKYTAKALSMMDKLSHDEYKRIKHMTKLDLIDYLTRVWNDGFEKGKTVGHKEAQDAFNAAAVEKINAEKADEPAAGAKKSAAKKTAPAKKAEPKAEAESES